jgi:hypothetical protein
MSPSSVAPQPCKWTLASYRVFPLKILRKFSFTGWGCQPHALPPHWRTSPPYLYPPPRQDCPSVPPDSGYLGIAISSLTQLHGPLKRCFECRFLLNITCEYALDFGYVQVVSRVSSSWCFSFSMSGVGTQGDPCTVPFSDLFCVSTCCIPPLVPYPDKVPYLT